MCMLSLASSQLRTNLGGHFGGSPTFLTSCSPNLMLGDQAASSLGEPTRKGGAKHPTFSDGLAPGKRPSGPRQFGSERSFSKGWLSRTY